MPCYSVSGLWLVPGAGFEPARLVGCATNTRGFLVPRVYQFHHPGESIGVLYLGDLPRVFIEGTGFLFPKRNIYM